MATPPRQGRTATAILRIVVAGFAYRGVTMQRVLSDTGSCYRSPPRYGIGATMGSRPPATCPMAAQNGGLPMSGIRGCP
jgi:hypothetical protein